MVQNQSPSLNPSINLGNVSFVRVSMQIGQKLVLLYPLTCNLTWVADTLPPIGRLSARVKGGFCDVIVVTEVTDVWVVVMGNEILLLPDWGCIEDDRLTGVVESYTTDRQQEGADGCQENMYTCDQAGSSVQWNKKRSTRKQALITTRYINFISTV